jgi:hypothetical protein
MNTYEKHRGVGPLWLTSIDCLQLAVALD